MNTTPWQAIVGKASIAEQNHSAKQPITNSESPLETTSDFPVNPVAFNQTRHLHFVFSRHCQG